MHTDRFLTHIFTLVPAVLAVALGACSFIEEGSPLQPFLACSDIILSKSGASSYFPSSIYAFIYINDGAGRLDAMQHIDNPGNTIELKSTSGARKALLVAGSESAVDDLHRILRFDEMSALAHNLRDEDPGSPVLTASFRFNAGSHSQTAVELRPMLCRVCLKSLEVDFSSCCYGRDGLTDIKLYLTNVNTACTYSDDGPYVEDLVNCGACVEGDVALFRHPEMILGEYSPAGCTLYCYPRERQTGGGAVSPSRLVIEGKIDGHNYYYPIDIGGGAVERGMSYSYGVTITRAGSTDPDIPADISAISVVCHAEDWKEYDYERIEY